MLSLTAEYLKMGSNKSTSGPKIKCLKCGDIIQSMSVHDFKWCKCRAIAVDGGGEYTRTLGYLTDMEFFKDIDKQEKRNDTKTV